MCLHIQAVDKQIVTNGRMTEKQTLQYLGKSQDSPCQNLVVKRSTSDSTVYSVGIIVTLKRTKGTHLGGEQHIYVEKLTPNSLYWRYVKREMMLLQRVFDIVLKGQSVICMRQMSVTTLTVGRGLSHFVHYLVNVKRKVHRQMMTFPLSLLF